MRRLREVTICLEPDVHDAWQDQQALLHSMHAGRLGSSGASWSLDTWVLHAHPKHTVQHAAQRVRILGVLRHSGSD